ncbi:MULTISPECIES: DUF6611 family protein [Bacteria]|uniref:DUF6611 family protein n=1 Tax=Bacteria TaxID=2 RepID=UPI003C7D1EC5
MANERLAPRWGYVSRTAGRYGIVSSRLVVYPPDAPEGRRLFADLSHRFTPLAVIGGVLAWAALCGLGATPELAALAVLLVAVPVAIFLAVKAAPVRRRAVAISSCCSALRPDAEDLACSERLEVLAAAIQGAGSALLSGIIREDAFDRVWRAVYAEVAQSSGEEPWSVAGHEARPVERSARRAPSDA